jgi:hypothetical protein
MNSKMRLPNKNKIYTAREAMKFLPKLGSEPALRKFLEEDIRGDNMLGAMILLRGKQRRFFIKGSKLLEYVNIYNKHND